MAGVCFLLLVFNPSGAGVFRLFRFCGSGSCCGAGSGESVVGRETSHWASCCVSPGIAACMKESHRLASYLVPKTPRVVAMSESRSGAG